MLYFENDYCEGAHPAILQKLTETNFEKVSGYGTDPYCASAKAKICAACGCPDADVYFISGGTQTNAIVIASMLQRWQGVLAAATGHVAAHEAGAIEYTSHKVIPLPAHEGKVSAADVRSWCATFYADANHDHMVFPGMVYISHPSEYGTLYTKAELEELHAVCQEYKMPLFMDGARLGYGLMAKGTDVTLQDIARLTDVFYIGGTKVGALCGEAWHKAGMLENKQNVFDDFIAAAEYLIAEKYTSSDKLAIRGGSNGGLLVGACEVQRPDLYAVCFPAVGVMDMLRYHKFTIGWGWAVEYGSSDNEEQFSYIYKYSPLHNIKEGTKYPATLVTTADHDDRVVPAHSFKFAAAMQHAQAGDAPILIRIESKAGHGAGKPTSKRIDEATDQYAFLFQNIGVPYKVIKN